VFFVCCSAAQLSYCQQTTSKTKPFNGKENWDQRRPEVIDTVIQFKKSAASKAQTETKPAAPDKTKDIDSVALVSEVDSLENKDSVSVVATPHPPTPNIRTKEPVRIEVGKAEYSADEPVFEGSVDVVISKYAEQIERDPHEINNYPLYRFIDKWYGTRYKWGGTDDNGIDCSAFSQKLYENIYHTAIVRTARQQHKNCERIKEYTDAAEGDLVFFRIHHVRISHVGVYLANGYFVHASRSQGVVISNLSTPYWHRRYASCGKVHRETKSVLESDYTVSPTE
jgi:cell wall-associated NlpC family hydrolase